MEISQYSLHHLLNKLKTPRINRPDVFLKKYFISLFYRIKTLGYTETMEEYELRKLGIFNQLNFFQLLCGILIPAVGFMMDNPLSIGTWLIACLPAMVSLLVLILNKRYYHEIALLAYFILYPFVTSIVYMNGFNPGINLHFILFGILSVFFLKDLGYMIFSLSVSMLNYFLLSVVLKIYRYQLENFNPGLYLINQALAIVFIFYGLYLIKKEYSVYQFRILDKNSVLQLKNIQIQEQADKIRENAALLQKQTEELTELNALKNKLFSIISHDLKAPMYAMRNFFSEVQQNNLPARELKKMIPGVVNDLTYTTGLMDNLLQWSRAQMQSEAVYPQKVDIGKSIEDTIQLLRRQSEAKQIRIETDTCEDIYGFMDKDMLNLVLRNLISNAIKFTPEKGNIKIGVHENHSLVEVSVQDNGTGISREALQKINSNDFYSTKGTASESGTGLGLKLCKEFMARNGGHLYIESKPGEGSIFSFSLPKSA
jgi:two-component system sensor histidine kinase/response regulator